MSARDWTACPKCEKTLADEKAKKLKTAKARYGKVSAEQYEKLLAGASVAVVLKDTLRHDYEIGVSDDRFHVSYSCSCTECGFAYTFKREEKLKL